MKHSTEVRELGVGYFKFSQDGATRKEEMRRLEELRRETVDAKKKHKEEKKNEQVEIICCNITFDR